MTRPGITGIWSPSPWLSRWTSHCYPPGQFVVVVDRHQRRHWSVDHLSNRSTSYSHYVKSYQWLKNWHSTGYPDRRQALQVQCWDWLAQCQYTATRQGWKFEVPGVIGSALRLVGPMSVYCDWARLKLWSASSVSVWQHVKLSVQIRLWDTPAYCWGHWAANKQQQLSSTGFCFCFFLPLIWLGICLNIGQWCDDGWCFCIHLLAYVFILLVFECLGQFFLSTPSISSFAKGNCKGVHSW